MLNELKIGPDDNVVEFAPGRGLTTKMVLTRGPKSYMAVERDSISQQAVQDILDSGKRGQCVVGTAQETGLPDERATVVFGEAMLTMQSNRNEASNCQRGLSPIKSLVVDMAYMSMFFG